VHHHSRAARSNPKFVDYLARAVGTLTVKREIREALLLAVQRRGAGLNCSESMKCVTRALLADDGKALEESLFMRFVEVDRAISRSTGQLLNERFGISFAQAKALTYLARQQFVTLAQLAHQLNHDPGTVSRLISRLVVAGYMAKMRHIDDRRCCFTALTERGADMAVKIIAALEKVEDELITGLTGDEVRHLTTLLQRVTINAARHRNDIPVQALDQAGT
jgi:DNA-binding MarR family transcriptional regulator